MLSFASSERQQETLQQDCWRSIRVRVEDNDAVANVIRCWLGMCNLQDTQFQKQRNTK